MATEPTYTTQSTLYGTTGGPTTEEGGVKSVMSSFQGSRTFFIVDMSRMVGENDTVKEAKVVYLPESEFEKSLYHSRCSCLIGVADAFRNFTGKFPQFFTMAGTCYACKLLEPNYFMFLLGRPFEPGERVLSSLQHIFDIFHFYYHSPEAVMNKSRGDWETFTANMTFIFSKIKDYVFRDPHSIPFMFETLPYSQSGKKRKRCRLFLLASRILRSCQQHEPIIGGCIMHNAEIVCNQLSPGLMEKLQLVGGGGIALNTKSILADNVAPETVWVLEVYLSPKEVEDLDSVQKDLSQHKRAYADMTPNHSLIDTTFTFTSRLQSSSSRSSVKPVKRVTKTRSHVPARVPNSASVDEDYYNLPPITITETKLPHMDSCMEGDRQSLVSVQSDDTAVFNPDNSTVSVFYRKNRRIPWESSSPQASRTRGERSKVETRGGSKNGKEIRGRERAASNREMPRLHGMQQRIYDPRYDDPDEFLAAVPSSTHKTQADTISPLNKPPSSNQDKPNIPMSLSIPIAGNEQSGASSPHLSVTGSSVEEERYTTPPPSFPSLFTPQPETQSIQIPALESSSCVDHSLSFQTADELSNPSHSLSPPEQQSPSNQPTEKHELSIHITPPPPVRPPKFVQSSHASSSSKPLPYDLYSHQRRSKLEESGDFVDSDLLDQLIEQSRLERDFESLQVQSPARGGKAGRGGDRKNRPLPALPSGNDGTPLPPQLPPRGQSINTCDEDELIPTKDLTEFVGDSGEFNIVTPPPPVLPKRLSAEIPTECRMEECTAPPSPPPRTLSASRKMESAQGTSAETSSKQPAAAQDLDDDVPPQPPPRERRGLNVPEVDGNSAEDSPAKSGSSSPDYQHRDLTQLERQGASSAESQHDPVTCSDGEREREGEVEENEGSGYDRVQDEEQGTSVDPVDEERAQSKYPDDNTDDATSLASSVKTLTSNEESGEEATVRIKNSTLLYRHTPTSKGEVAGVHADGGSVYDSIQRRHFPVTPGSADVSLQDLNTPETTLQFSALQDMHNSKGTMADSEGIRVDSPLLNGEGMMRSRTATVDSDMEGVTRPRGASRIQTLGRQLQPPAVQPAPQLETRCLYVQRHFNTVLVLVAKAGLHKNHTLLTEMWKELLPQLFTLDQGFESKEERERHRGQYNLAVYQNADGFCAVECPKALYRFRHAIRYTHLEYQKNPDLCQVSLLLNAPGACRMMGQKVMGRETFYHYQKSTVADVFNTTVIVARNARQTKHPLLSGDTPSQFL